MRRRDASRSQQATGSYGNTHALSHGSEGQCSSERAHSVHSSPASALIRPNIDPRPSVSRPESGSRAGRSIVPQGLCRLPPLLRMWRGMWRWRLVLVLEECGSAGWGGAQEPNSRPQQVCSREQTHGQYLSRKQDPSLKVRARPRVVRTLTFALSERSPHVFTSSSSRKRT
ncbi:hypothetical protein INR49_006669 [Caranx melampygus]|nr:hypothetical protein INR49_006669 [Caranx melampygus]